MNASYSPVGCRIVQIGGLLESRRTEPLIEGYTAVLSFDDEHTVLLAQSDFAKIDQWPENVTSLPIQVIDGSSIEGETVTAVFRTIPSAGAPSQLFLLLDSSRIVGLVNAARGSVLHVESAFTAPILRGDPDIRDLQGSPISLDSILSL